MKYLAATILAVFAASTAHAVVLCAKPRSDGSYSTNLKMREACRDGETVVKPSTLGYTLPPVVKDATGRIVGPLEYGNGIESVLMTVGGIPAFFEVYREGGLVMLPGSANWIGYENPDCTGSELLDVPNGESLLPFGFVGGTAGALTAYAPSGVVSSVTLNSYGVLGTPRTPTDSQAACDALWPGLVFTPPAICCSRNYGPVVETVTPALKEDVSHFVSPFHVELQ